MFPSKSVVTARRALLLLPLGLLTASAFGLSLSDLSNQDATAGLKAALEKGANTAVANLGRPNGFLGNDKVKIQLPGALEQAMPLLRLTGIYCPGCGGLRSAHSFIHGDLLAALQANALAVVGYLGFAVLWTVWVVRAVRGRPVRIELGSRQLWVLGTLSLVFTVVRNLPFGGWLHP